MKNFLSPLETHKVFNWVESHKPFHNMTTQNIVDKAVADLQFPITIPNMRKVLEELGLKTRTKPMSEKEMEQLVLRDCIYNLYLHLKINPPAALTKLYAQEQGE